MRKGEMEVGSRNAEGGNGNGKSECGSRNSEVELDRWNSVNLIIKDRAQRFHNFQTSLNSLLVEWLIW
jgi:hypothetical protein